MREEDERMHNSLGNLFTITHYKSSAREYDASQAYLAFNLGRLRERLQGFLYWPFLQPKLGKIVRHKLDIVGPVLLCDKVQDLFLYLKRKNENVIQPEQPAKATHSSSLFCKALGFRARP